MNGAWRSLGAEWRQSPARVLGPQAVAGVRNWQQVLAEAAPGELVIDAWPREPDVAPLLSPTAQSPLHEPWRGPGANGAQGSEPVSDDRDWRAARSAQAARSTPAARGEPPVQGAAPAKAGGVGNSFSIRRSGLWTDSQPRLQAGAGLHDLAQHAGPAGRFAGRLDEAEEGARAHGSTGRHFSSLAQGSPTRVAALLAGLMARHHGAQEGPAAATPRLALQTAAPLQQPVAPAFGNVVPLRGAAGVHAQQRPARGTSTSSSAHTRAGSAQALQHWGRVLDAAATPAAGVTALLALGERATWAAATALVPGSASASGWRAAEALVRPASAAPPASPASGLAPFDTTRAAQSARTWLHPPAAPEAPAPQPADSNTLAHLAASMARIEIQLASTGPAPAAPQWLEDDDALAGRIHDILRRQARRHGIQTP